MEIKKSLPKQVSAGGPYTIFMTRRYEYPGKPVGGWAILYNTRN
jgi:hypothetical protein